MAGAEQPRQPARDREAKTGTAEILRRRRIGLRERLEETLEDLGRADVTCVDDVIDARKRSFGFPAKQSVRVGNDADEDGSAQFFAFVGLGFVGLDFVKLMSSFNSA